MNANLEHREEEATKIDYLRAEAHGRLEHVQTMLRTVLRRSRATSLYRGRTYAARFPAATLIAVAS
jgi:hypothetical protein